MKAQTNGFESWELALKTKPCISMIGSIGFGLTKQLMA